MTEPTLESLNEAARKARFDDWNDAYSYGTPSTDRSIIAHALTLDKLHGRNEASEAELFYLTVMRLSLGSSDWGEDRSQLGHLDKDAIALIEAKFAELRAPKEPEWIEWQGGECPVADDTRVEVKFRSGECNSKFKAGTWNWKHSGWASDIIAYRVL